MFVSNTIIAAANLGSGVTNEANTLTGQFGVDWTFFIAQCINFIIVAGILWYFAFKPVIKTLEERKQKITDGLQFAEDMKVRLADTEKQVAEKLRKASEESLGIVKEARDNAAQFMEKQTQEAVQHAEHIVEKAKDAMTQERKQMLIEIRQEVAELVVQASAKVLDTELSLNDRKRFSETAAKAIYENN